MFRIASAQPNYSGLFLANQNTTGATQTPLSLGNWTSPTTVPSFYFNTSDNGTSNLDIHSTRWGSLVSFTRSDPSGNSYNIMQVGGNNAAAASLNLFNTSNQVTLQLNAQGTTYFNSGNVGIGTTAPGNALEVATTAQLDGLRVSYNGTAMVCLHPNSLTTGAYNNIVANGDAGIIFGTTNSSPVNFGFVIAPWSANTGGIRIASNGNVLIGKASQTNTGYVLDVNGNARINGVVVNTTGADYVFDPGYRLTPLKELAAYLQQQHHLPGILPAAEMQQQGVDLGDNQTKLLAKIEELTLYLIEKDKEIDTLKEKTKQLEARNSTLEDLEKRVESLERSSR